GLINYVTCALSATATSHYWAIVSTTGNYDQATQFNVLWTDNSANQPTTRDCTIVTNGDNFLQVYLDNNLVYSSNNLSLQMPAPFNAFLEVQSSFAGKLLYSSYKDFYATTTSSITVQNAPHSGKVNVVSSDGKTILASGTVGSSGSVSIDVGKYHLPLSASIQAYDATGKLVASTSSTVTLWGGDVYTVGAS